MKKKDPWNPVWVPALFCTLMWTCIYLMGCTPPGLVRAEPLLPVVERLVDRHDAYAAVDSSLSPLQRRVNKRDGELVLKAFNTALEDKEETNEEE